MGCCAVEDLGYNAKTVKHEVEDLLGEGASADDKFESGRVLDMIGYRIDLDIQRVSIARKNVMHSMVSFYWMSRTGR